MTNMNFNFLMKNMKKLIKIAKNYKSRLRIWNKLNIKLNKF